MALDASARHVLHQHEHSSAALDATIDNLLRALQLDCSKCCEAWLLRHRHQLKGSTAVLKQLAASQSAGLKLLLSRPETRKPFLHLMQSLQQRSELISSNSKGWQQAASREAAVACCMLRESCSSGSLVGYPWASWVAVTSASALAIVGVAMLAARPQAVQVRADFWTLLNISSSPHHAPQTMH